MENNSGEVNRIDLTSTSADDQAVSYTHLDVYKRQSPSSSLPCESTALLILI